MNREFVEKIKKADSIAFWTDAGEPKLNIGLVQNWSYQVPSGTFGKWANE